MFAGASERSKLVLQVLFIIALCTGAVVLIYSMMADRAPSGEQRVEFQVQASGGFAIITLDTGDSASITKPTTVSVPWKKTLHIASGTEVYLTASNPTQTGQITCTIILNTDPWKTDTATAPQDGVACAGIVP